MHILLIAIAAIVFGSGVLVKSITTNLPGDTTNNSQVLNTTDEKVEVEIRNEVSTESPDPTTTPESTPTPDANQDSQSSNQNINNNLIYPSSTKVSANLYQSTDNVDTITDWYKNKLDSLDYPVTSFVTTSVNDKVENKLVTDSGNQEIRITITKEASSERVNIEIIN